MFRYLAQLLIVVSALSVISGKGYNEYKLYDVIPRTPMQSNVLKTFAEENDIYDFITLSRLPGKSAKIIVQPEEVENFESFLQQNSFEYKLLNSNIGRSIRRNYLTNRLLRQGRMSKRLTTDRYYSHTEINDYIEYLAKTYPNRVFVKTVGVSFEGRLLKTILITNGDKRIPAKNVVLMDGGFHAREWISPASVIYVIEQLVENFNANAHLLLDYNWVILPVVNADGYEYSQLSEDTRFWRKTRQPLESSGNVCYGTDPNRNFDFHWNEEGASSEPCSNTFAGPKAFSEPEAVTVRDLINSYADQGIMYLTVHSCGSFLLYPWGWSSDVPDTWRDLHEVAQTGADAIFLATGTNYTVGSSTNVLYVAAGASDDYAFNAGFPISFTMELPCDGSNGFDAPPSMIDSYVKETWIGIRAMAEKLIEKYPLNE